MLSDVTANRIYVWVVILFAKFHYMFIILRNPITCYHFAKSHYMLFCYHFACFLVSGMERKELSEVIQASLETNEKLRKRLNSLQHELNFGLHRLQSILFSTKSKISAAAKEKKKDFRTGQSKTDCLIENLNLDIYAMYLKMK